MTLDGSLVNHAPDRGGRTRRVLVHCPASAGIANRVTTRTRAVPFPVVDRLSVHLRRRPFVGVVALSAPHPTRYTLNPER